MNSDDDLVDFMGGAVPHQQVQWQNLAAGAAFGYYMGQQVSNGQDPQVVVTMIDQNNHYYAPVQQEKLYTSGEILWTFIKMVLLWAAIIWFWVWLLT